jgi:Tfp pilus assembly protein PilP
MCKKTIIVGLAALAAIGLLRFSAPAQDAAPAQESAPVQESATSASTTETAPIAFIITDEVLRELHKQEFSEELLTQLATLKDTLFHTEKLFLNGIEEAIGQEALEQHKATLLELAYVYDSTGRREPFKPDDGGEEPAKLLDGEECPGPLGKYEIGQFQVIGILLGEPGDRARIKAPDGESYTITMDICLGPHSGKVVAISENCVTIKETKRYEKDDEVSVEEPETDLCLKTPDE